MDFTQKVSCLIFLFCILISMKNQSAETNKDTTNRKLNKFWSSSTYSKPPISFFQSDDVEKEVQESGATGSLAYNYYNNTCHDAEDIIRSIVREMYGLRPEIAPALLRLVFHDCFVHGCDASVLLDAVDGVESEKKTPPNQSLKGYEFIDIIKSKLEEDCPGVVSCADIVVLAARESVVLAGGPFYPLYTGRRDSITPFPDEAAFELPSPHDHLPKVVQSFASRGFDQREMVSLLGAHSIGTIHCKFFQNRLSNFNGTNEPDPSIDPDFLNQLRTQCGSNQSSVSPSLSPLLSPSPSASTPRPSTPRPSTPRPSTPRPSTLTMSEIEKVDNALDQDPGMRMDYEGRGTSFGTLYYRSLLQSRGLLFVDQQMTAGEDAKNWVEAYASDLAMFHKDFALAMGKLSNHQVLVAPAGVVRRNCRRLD